MRTVLFAVCFLMSSVLIAQKPFAGTVNFKWNIAGEGAEMMEAMMPTNLVVVFGKAGSRVTFEGGMMSAMFGEFVYNAKSDKSYMIKADEEVAYLMSDEEENAQPVSSYDKEDEIITIQGYACQKYKMTSMSNGVESVSYVWLTNDIKPYHSDKGSKIGFNGVSADMGFPMKIVTSADGITVTMTAEKIDPTVPNKALFAVPKGYDVKPYTDM